MLGDPFLHHLGVRLLFDHNTRFLSSLGEVSLIMGFLDLLRSIFVPFAPELELLFLLELVNNVISVDLNLFKDVILVRLCLDLNCFIDHLA